MLSLPGAIAMYGLALGISHVGSTLPGPVYALLCGLNAATVGMIALAAVQLSRNAITDQLSRLLVYFSGAAGILYTSLWYFPVIMIIAGLIAGVWDSKWFQSAIGATKRRYTTWRTRGKGNVDVESATSSTSTPEESGTRNADVSISEKSDTDSIGSTTVSPPVQVQLISWKAGIFFVGLFVASLVVIVAVRAALKKRSRGLSLFSNFYLAGTMIFGGGPVVIPLLREYTVADGWVSPRDFLLGLAIIQAFPGPNFNFAVYLGTLATAKSALPSYVGALISFLGMYTPGFILALGSMGLWSRLRSQHWLRSILRGINAAAVGLIFTAVYRLWRVGLVSPTYQRGTSLWNEPWWLAVTAGSFVGGAWFHIKAPVAILLGGVMGLIWYAIVQA
ncbi:MAG: hypothetical protein M1816_005947 [Peltula sp. TS41687]|nr:MAG: hypothetical protein M1816_005947 [Peltula sp. TS41687]